LLIKMEAKGGGRFLPYGWWATSVFFLWHWDREWSRPLMVLGQKIQPWTVKISNTLSFGPFSSFFSHLLR